MSENLTCMSQHVFYVEASFSSLCLVIVGCILYSGVDLIEYEFDCGFVFGFFWLLHQ